MKAKITFDKLTDAIHFAHMELHKQGRSPNVLILSRQSSMRLVFELGEALKFPEIFDKAPTHYCGLAIVVIDKNAEDYFEFGYYCGGA